MNKGKNVNTMNYLSHLRLHLPKYSKIEKYYKWQQLVIKECITGWNIKHCSVFKLICDRPWSCSQRFLWVFESHFLCPSWSHQVWSRVGLSLSPSCYFLHVFSTTAVSFTQGWICDLQQKRQLNLPASIPAHTHTHNHCGSENSRKGKRS